MEVNKIYEGNSLSVLKTLPDESIDCCVTSPPYWGLRDYGHDEQLGNEEHFETFITNLCNIFDEVKRVLKPEGTCWINLGDTYGSSGSGTTKNNDTSKYIANSKQVYVLPNGTAKASQFRGTGLNKSLLMIPERFAIEMISRGWILRNQIIWHKPNQMPSSATDRFTVDFEKMFFFVKSPHYYFEQQLEPYETELDRWGGEQRGDRKNEKFDPAEKANANSLTRTRDMRPNKNGRNMRTVWSINTEPCGDAHFATYPQKLVLTPIQSGCPENGIVLDPFFGSGTTGIYARKANRKYIGIEINPEYIKIANDRLYKELGMWL